MSEHEPVEFVLNGAAVAVADEGCSLLETLRDRLGVRSPKDGCSPQGQCGCCTVWVDGSPRVACVTPVARVRGRAVTTVEGLSDADAWADAFCTTGGSQCGFCTPGIIMRLAALGEDARRRRDAVERALLAHLCRCTGWQTVIDAATAVGLPSPGVHRDLEAATTRATLEGGVPQSVGPPVALGRGGFADDSAPADALVAIQAANGEWVVGDTVREARSVAGIVQGRRSTAPLRWPIDLPDGDWLRTLQTTWVEPAYLELDASWCAPGGEPASPLGNGGAFGGKSTTDIDRVARRLADEHGKPVRALRTREETVRAGPKRPPLALGLRADGSGVLRLARPADPEVEERVSTLVSGPDVPTMTVEFVDVEGPPVSLGLRAAVWAEVAAGRAALQPGPDRVVAPNGATATAVIIEREGAEVVDVRVRCGQVLDAAVLRSYCVGAAHMALGWVRSEGLAVGADGVPLDLTIRSFGILRAVDTPWIEVTIEPDDGEPVNGSDAVFAAVAAAVWRVAAHPGRWPVDG